MLKKILWVWAFLLGFYGCSGISFDFDFIPSKPEESYIQATRKGELVWQDKTQIVVVATHLNDFDEKKYPKEEGDVFFLDVYQSNSHNKGFLENGYTLRLSNGEQPTEILPLKKKELQGLMKANAMRWGEYYFVRFMPQDKRTRDSLRLIISHPDFGENQLNFGFKALKKK